MPKVLNALNLRNSHNLLEIPENAVYVGGACIYVPSSDGKWGTPFFIGNKRVEREQASALYRDWLLHGDGQKLLDDIGELVCKDLICWCAPLPCHADILLQLAATRKEEDSSKGYLQARGAFPHRPGMLLPEEVT